MSQVHTTDLYSVRGPFLITQALRPHIPCHDNARIIFISSVSARICGPGRTMYTGGISVIPVIWYADIIQASKAAIESFARTWNNEFGVRQGITINAVNPGPVQCVCPTHILRTDIVY
jgi:3-oxoacyl-[acyl-carrier protein] reductase